MSRGAISANVMYDEKSVPAAAVRLGCNPDEFRAERNGGCFSCSLTALDRAEMAINNLRPRGNFDRTGSKVSSEGSELFLRRKTAWLLACQESLENINCL